jgi:hypothetical protein
VPSDPLRRRLVELGAADCSVAIAVHAIERSDAALLLKRRIEGALATLGAQPALHAVALGHGPGALRLIAGDEAIAIGIEPREAALDLRRDRSAVANGTWSLRRHCLRGLHGGDGCEKKADHLELTSL